MKTTKEKILQKTASVFALQGYESFSIRSVAKEIPIAPSVLYHHFADKDELLKDMYLYLNKKLGKKRAELIQPKSALDMLKQRIDFQIENQDEIVAVLKYYIGFRRNFKRFKSGFVPDKSALHIEEVLEFGNKTGEFSVKNIEDDAKVIAHAINGFLLEYFPYKPEGKEREELITKIYNFLIRALKGGEIK